MTQESYQDKLRRHSYESRIDPLRDAAREVLAAWDGDATDEELRDAHERLRTALTSVRRGGEEDVPEVEVTDDRSPVHVEAPERPVAARRSAAKNVSAPEYQEAFISEARHSMGQPTKEDAEALLGRSVLLTFNAETARGMQARGILTKVIDHPAIGGPQVVVYLMLDDDKDAMYPLNSVQSIEVVS